MRVVGLVLGVVLAGCVRALPPVAMTDDVLAYRTDDGWINGLRHYPGEGPPVLLVHGMGVDHHNWDFRPEVSLARYLQEAGYDVWVPDLRGDPGTAPGELEVSFDNHARLDAPAAVDAVLAITGAERLAWVGHSMGGMLLYTALSADPSRLAAGVAIASPATLAHPKPIHKLARSFAFLTHGEGVLPLKGLGRVALDLGLGGALERRLATHDSMSRPMLRGLALHALQPLSKATAREAMAWLDDGRIVDQAGAPMVSGNASGPAVPLLVMGGPADGLVPEPDVAAACGMFSPCTYVRLGVEQGFSHDFGHVDPVVGRMAAVEIFPRVLRFLNGHREGDRWRAP